MILSPFWLAAALISAVCVSLRTALQHKLRGELSLNAAAVVRYFYGVPVAVLLLVAYLVVFGGALPSLSWSFLMFCAAGGLAQILGTNFLIMAFEYRGFTVGTAYAKTEALQGAFLALVILGERIRVLAWVGIAISIAGVLWLSLAGKTGSGKELLRATFQPAALCGLAAGLSFAAGSVLLKAAIQAVDGEDVILRGIVTLVVTSILQTFMQGGWLVMRQPAQARAVLTSWRTGVPVGALSACGTGAMIVGFALAPVALVRAVSQVEILFTLLFGRFFLRERTSGPEIAGALTVVFGVVLVLLG